LRGSFTCVAGRSDAPDAAAFVRASAGAGSRAALVENRQKSLVEI